MRKAGILLPIFSLPNSYGIGTLGKEAYQFIDFLNKAKQSYWQVLPVGPTSYGDSPYQSFSTFAVNPYFIDFDLLKEDGLLEINDYDYLKDESLRIDYAKLYQTRFIVLKKAYQKFDLNLLKDFEKENKYWLDDYAIFMCIKDLNNGISFNKWDHKLVIRDKKAIDEIINEHLNDINFYKFLQYEFFKQWHNLKQYANKKGIKIIGDMPIYTAYDSSDVWSKPNYFMLDKNLTPIKVAGCPPDDFSKTGQLWGNPLYNYDVMKKDNYSWWKERFNIASRLYDVVRIDHFRGFEAYYTIPYGDVDATRGTWEKGPNVNLFKEVEKEIKGLDIIAENLGFLTKEVDDMLNNLGYPGMKILEFGFDPKDNDSKPHNLSYNMVVYPGTHDNMPIMGWYNTLDERSKNYLHEYLHFDNPYEAGNKIIRCALSSVCKLAIISFVDYLQKGNEARINTPSTLAGNWQIRIEKGDMNDDLALYIAHLMDIYHR